MRSLGDLTSENTRKLVGKLFSLTPPEKQLKDIPKDAYSCFTVPRTTTDKVDKSSFFFIYPDPSDKNKTIIQIHRALGRDPYGLSTVKVPIKLDIDQLEFTISNGQFLYLVTDPDNALNAVFNIDSELMNNFQLSVQYTYGKPFSISLMQDNKTLERGFVSSCRKGLFTGN